LIAAPIRMQGDTMDHRTRNRVDVISFHAEINRLRKRDNLEDVGGLGLAHKLYTHFHVERNARVAEALDNLERINSGAPAQPPGAKGPA